MCGIIGISSNKPVYSNIINSLKSKIDEFENNKAKVNKNIFIEEIFEGLFRNKKIPPNKIYNIAKNLNIGTFIIAPVMPIGAEIEPDIKPKTALGKKLNLGLILFEFFEQSNSTESFASFSLPGELIIGPIE